MAITPTAIKGERREEFGKGSARRLRRDGKIPGVLYEKGIDNVHFAVDRIEMTAIVRNDGTNAILELEVEGDKNLAMVKHVDQNVLSLDIDHIDLLGIKRGEKVTVEVPVHVEGEAAPETVVTTENATLSVEAPATDIPEFFTVSVEGLEAGTQILAKDITLPEGVTLDSDEELLVVNITEQISAEALEAELAEAEAEAGIEQDEPETEGDEDAEGESGDDASAEGGDEAESTEE